MARKVESFQRGTTEDTRKGNKSNPNHYDLNTSLWPACTYLCSIMKEKVTEKLKKKGKVMFALEIALYFIIAISVALAIIL